MMVSIATCIAVALALAGYAHWKGRTGWHWLVFAICGYGVTWLSAIVALDFTGINVSFGSHKLAVFAGGLTGITTLIILISVPERPRRHFATASREPPP
jgi:hypothetical protein